jgi:phage terminase small subunit
MPPLVDPKHEAFVHNILAGQKQADAYVAAGFKANDSNCSRLFRRADVQARLAELQERAAEKAVVTKERVLAELAKIGFSDIRKAVKWYSQANVAQIDQDADTEALVDEGAIRFAVQNQVELVSSDAVDDDTAAAISEISMTDKGGLKVKFHDKRAALVDIGKHLGMFTEKVEHSGPDGGPIEIADADLARLIAFTLTKASREAA